MVFTRASSLLGFLLAALCVSSTPLTREQRIETIVHDVLEKYDELAVKHLEDPEAGRRRLEDGGGGGPGILTFIQTLITFIDSSNVSFPIVSSENCPQLEFVVDGAGGASVWDDFVDLCPVIAFGRMFDENDNEVCEDSEIETASERICDGIVSPTDTIRSFLW
eukprot:CAMPEP_0118688882 /NCGR_PEP_ID=MMETSP0800-20121206/9164_1 /TAXON_ID=210618 ORGANISM="Striatella unipunctata, Strain CCMP2910" /NCGR_SAMPLE_ID=MMETSP0800 /ASSEMBLY_ACC=CAM_ASM_000638 /LENGTH=163 /DNA_ID=CAMNT_0006586185 /DNA_START=63 /DNA_END=551 /DNA_ORIENTATION=+